MLPQEIIRKKRDKQNLSAEEIDFFVRGVTDGTIADCQIGSFTMAAFLNGLDAGETKNLTLAMRDSGDVLQWPELDAPVVDKHSSGGVGDKVSLMLAPMLAAAGVYVPMISGRGLGHTGGTLDKFDSVPGYQTHPDNDLFRAAVKEVGCAVISQTGSLAPADKKIYAVRDVSATVESIPLITASILSKKLAAGLDCLIMDLKFGNGAFMESIDDGRALARSIVSVAGKAGTKTKALLTDMNQVLGTTAGNAVEVKEAVDYLKGINVDPRLHEITLRLAAELLVTAGCFADAGEARKRLLADLDSGRSPEVFARMVKKLGGPADFVERPEKYLPRAAIVKPVFPLCSGYVESMNTRNIGLSIIGLKGGRTSPEQKLDYATGYTGFCQIGDYVDEQNPLAFVHAESEEDYNFAADELQRNIVTANEKPQINPAVAETVE